MLDATKKNTTVGGKVYGLPHIWGTDGLVVNTKLAKMADYPDLCKAEYKGKTSVRLKRPTLLAFAFASGKDPFALYNDPESVRGADGRRRQDARRVQGEHQVLLGQQGPAAQRRCAPARSSAR